MSQPYLGILGVLEVADAEGAAVKLPTRKAEALAAILAVSNRIVSRDRLLGLLWGDRGEAQARHSLSQALTALRRTFGNEAIVADRDAVSVDPHAIDIDAEMFRDLIARDDVAALKQALSLLRGPVLHDFGLRGPEFEDWLAAERRRFQSLGTDAALRLAALASAQGDEAVARDALAKALLLDPVSEAAHVALMRLHLDFGRPSAALRQYTEAAAVLRRELDATPGPELDAARQQARLVDVNPGVVAGKERGARKYATAIAVSVWPAVGHMDDPEEIQVRLDAALSEAASQLRAAGGQVVRTTPDQVLAAFGVPVALEDHAVRACRVSLAIRSALSAPGQAEIGLRIALDAGEVVLRPDAAGTMAFFGQAVQRAGRLIALPGAPPIIATQTVKAQTRGRFGFTALPTPTPLLPGARPETLFQPTGPVVTDVAPERSVFVGRSEELARLSVTCASAAAGVGQLVAVVGEAGIGKSRLVREFIATALRPGWHTIAAGTDPQFAEAAYYPFRGLLLAFFGLDSVADATAIRARVETALNRLGPPADLLAAPLLALLDCEPADPGWSQLEPDRRRRRMVEAVIQLLHCQSHVVPLLVVVEDLHWLDVASRELLEDLITSLSGARLLVLVNFRPEFQHRWAGREYFTQIRLDPLRADARTAMLDRLLGDDPELAVLKSILAGRTGGNPFFLEECVRALTAAGTLTGSWGHYQLADASAEPTVPGTVHAVIGARVDQLVASDRHLLQLAAVIGKDVPGNLLAAVSRLDEVSFQAALRRLQADEFLLPVRVVPEPVHRFKHALTHEVVYASLLRGHRRELHAAVLQALEDGAQLGGIELADALAHHAVRANDWDKALRYARQAGHHAAARNAGHAAIRYFEMAMQALKQLTSGPQTQVTTIELHFALRDELFVVGAHDRIPDHLDAAMAIAEAIGDTARLCRAWLIRSGWHWYAGQHRQALAAADAAYTLATQSADPLLIALSRYRQGVSHSGLGDYQAGAAELRSAIDIMEGASLNETVIFGGYPAIFCRNFLTWTLSELGEVDEALAVGQAGWAMAWARPNIYSRAVIAFGYGHALLRLGRLEAAREILEAGLGLYGSNELPSAYPYIAAPLGYLLVATGETERGLTYLRRANTAATRQMAPVYAHTEIWLAEAQRLTGDIDAATATLHRALAMAGAQEESGHTAWAQRALGDVLAERDPAAARKAYDAAATIAGPRGMRPLLAEVAAGRSRLPAMTRRRR